MPPSPAASPSSSRLRLILAALATLLIAILLWWLLRDSPTPEKEAKKPQQEEYVRPDPHPLAQRRDTHPITPPKPPPPQPGEDPPPVIDEIIVEKSEVCEGEENLITVRAHTINGTDEFLHYVIGSETGASVPLKSYIGDYGVADRSVMVFGRGNVVASVPVPNFTVKQCKVLRSAIIMHRLMSNTVGEFELSAKILEVGSKDQPNAGPFEPAKWIWDFGDGSSETTTVPVVEHSYEDRPQDTQYSQFLIKLEVLDTNGEKLLGRTSLQLQNMAFEELASKGIVTLMTAYTPRFPQLDDKGVVNQKVRLWHYRPDSVLITKVMRIYYFVGQADYSAPDYPSVESVLGTRYIPSGRGIEVPARFDTTDAEKVAHVTYWLEGTSAEGYPVRGEFSIMRPPKPPSQKDHISIYDPVLVAKIKAARKILGKDFVTDEEIWRLERTGELKPEDLEVDPASIADPAAVPTWLPKGVGTPPKDGDEHVEETPPPPESLRSPE